MGIALATAGKTMALASTFSRASSYKGGIMSTTCPHGVAGEVPRGVRRVCSQGAPGAVAEGFAI